MKKYRITYTVEGYYSNEATFENDVTIEEIEEMCYEDFPSCENYYVQVELLDEDDLTEEDNGENDE